MFLQNVGEIDTCVKNLEAFDIFLKTIELKECVNFDPNELFLVINQ
jgi:hypothetical protein